MVKMQKVFDEKDKVMEAFLQNPDFRNYGFFAATAAQSSPLNAYAAAQYPKAEAPNIVGNKDQSGVKAYTQAAELGKNVPLGLLSQMSRGAPSGVDVAAAAAAQNFITQGSNLNLMRPIKSGTDDVVQQALFESALVRMRFGDQAFVQPQQQPMNTLPVQPTQQDEKAMKQALQHQQTVTAAFRRNMTPGPVTSLENSVAMVSAPHGSLIAYPQREPLQNNSTSSTQQNRQANHQQPGQQAPAGCVMSSPLSPITSSAQLMTTSPTSLTQTQPLSLATVSQSQQETHSNRSSQDSRQSGYVCIMPARGNSRDGNPNASQIRSVPLATHLAPTNLSQNANNHNTNSSTGSSLSSVIPAHSATSGLSHNTSGFAPMSPEGQRTPSKKSIPPEQIATFMQEMQKLASTEVGKAMIPPQTLASLMQQIEQNAEEFLGGNTSSLIQQESDMTLPGTGTIRVKSEFANSSSNEDQLRAVLLGEQQYLTPVTDAKLKSELATQSLFAFNPDLRVKGLSSQQPMPLVVKPASHAKSSISSTSGVNVKSGTSMDILSPLVPLPNAHDFFPTNMSTKSTMKKPKERPHVCGVCQMAFTQKNHLQVHERKHTGEKPYRCTMCDSAFARKDGLVIHQRKHTGEKPYKCSFCDSAFTRKDKMVIHERTHTGERPYQCLQCDSKYTRKDKLTLHLRKHALAAQKEMEKAIQNTVGVVTSLALQGSNTATTVGTGVMGALSGPNSALNLQSVANLSLPLMSPNHSTIMGGTGTMSISTDSANQLPVSGVVLSPLANSTMNVANLGSLQNTIAANLSLPTVAVASNLQNNIIAAGNLTLAAANLNAVAANLSAQSTTSSVGLTDTGPANLSLHDGSVTDLSLHDSAGATNLSTTPLSTGS